MSRIVIGFFSFLLLIPQGLLAGQLTTVVMTKQTPDNACTQPPATTSFSTTDQAAWLWFLVSNVSVGDDYSVAFYTPAGASFGTPSDFGPETVPGTYCYAVGIDVAGYTPATMPGTWNAYIFNKGSQIYQEPFTITGSTATCSYTLSSNSASAVAAGGSGSFTVTAGSGCTWTASSDVTWITPAVSGSTVNYTVQANTSTSSRVGHITVGTQTFTVTQAGASGGGGTSTVTITEYPVPTAGSEPWGIAVGPDGNLWFTEDGKIGKITPAGAITEYPLPNVKSYANAIVAGPDGAMWFVEGGTQKIGRITTSGALTEYPVAYAPAGGRLTGIAVGPDGNLWYTDTDANSVGRISTSGIIMEYPVPTLNEAPWLITAGPDGAMWFTEDSKIGRVTTTGAVTEFSIPSPGGYPWGIAVGPDGALWFTEEKGSKIGRITTSGAVTEYPVTTTGGDLSGIALGPVSDGALWFSDNGANKIGRITTTGAVTEYPVPTSGAGLRLMVAGPDGAIWFTEQTRNQIGRLVLPGSAATCTYTLSSSSASVAAASGSGSFTVTAGSGCTVTASADVTWITPAVSGTTVSYTVQANTTTSSRTGHITVNGQTFTVTQAGASGGGTTTGYWQYIKTDSGIQPYAAGGAYPDTYSGVEGNFSVTITERVASGYPVPTLGATFTWSRPPATLIPGTVLSWPVSAKITTNANNGPPYLGFSMNANSYPYQPVSNLATVSPWATYYLIQLNIDWTSPAGTVATYDNASQTSPTLIPPGTSTWMDSNGQMTLLTHIRGSSDYYWSYVYQWVPASASCTYSLATSSASAAAAAGSGSFAVTTGAGCTLSAATADVTWITPTVSGTTVNYTVQANTSTSSRTGHITVNGQTFTVTQAGASGGSTATGNFTFNGFANTSGLTLVGSAAIASSSDGSVLRLTPATGDQSGAAYSTTPVTLGNNATFSTQFQFRFSSQGGTEPADGIVFVLGTSTQGLGGIGVGVGYQNVSGNSVGIEFDTYNNTGFGLGNDDGNSSNHVSIDTKGVLTNTDLTNVYGIQSCVFASGSSTLNSNKAAGCMSNGDLWTVNINYDGSKLTVTLTDPAKGSSFTAINGYAINLASILGQSTAYVGFTSGTGSGWENHDIVNWTFANTAQSVGSSPWTLITTSGDCPGSDVASSSGSSIPDPTKCTSAFNGYTAVCWPSSSGYAPNTCTYKNIAAASCTGGSHPGYLYRCDAGTATSCTYSLATSSASVGAGAGSGSFAVTTGAGCTLSSATADVTWITPTVSGTTVNYTVQANAGTSSRIGHITVNGQTFTVTQAAASGGPPTGCNYYVSPLSQSQPATPATSGGNITGLIQVTTGTIPSTTTGCPWTAASNSSWITILSGASNAGSGAASYKVDPNTLTTSRQGTMSIAYQTVTVSQAAGVACSYSVNPASDTIQALGGSSSVTVTVTGGASCSWTASVSSSASTWLHLGATTSGTGGGSVGYSADPNTSTAQRVGTMTVAGITVTVTQPGGASANGPTIAQAGIVNAADNRGGGIAQGSFFTIYGSNLGPATPQQVYQFPIPDNLGGVTVTITQGSTTVKAYMFYVSATQINAIMPSNAPLGNVQMAVNYNGNISTAMAATIVKTAYGIFSTASGPGPGIILNYNSVTDQPLNMGSIPAKPGQVEVMWGTGLGPITTPDNQAPPGGNLPVAVQVMVGGLQASVAYSGRAPGNAAIDQINFTVPAGVPTGCSIPVQVNAGGTWSNTVRMAISADGQHCKDSFNPLSGLSATGGNSATIGLMRVSFNGQVSASSGPTNATLDLGFGAFVKTNAGGDLAYSPFANLPAPGTCSSTNKMMDLGTMMGGGLSGLDPTVSATLDAGAQLTVTGGAGGASGTLTQTSPNPYMGLLGGILNVSGATVPPPFLDGGPFTVSGPGGKDVGPFSTTVALAPAITWTNPPSTINRASPLTLTWTGGDSTQTVVVIGSSTDQTSKAYGGFTCVAPAGAHSFTVPVNSLADMVSTTAAAGSSSSPIGMLGLMPLETSSMQLTPLPKGLDVGVVFNTTMTLETVQIQ